MSAKTRVLVAAPVVAVSLTSLTLAASPVRKIVDQATAVGNTSATLSSYAYDADNDVFYVAASGTDAGLRRLTWNSTTSSYSGQFMVEKLQWKNYLLDGNTNWSSSNGTEIQQNVMGMLFNPAAIGSISKGGAIWMMDQSSLVFDLDPNPDVAKPVTTKRIYRYNLQTATGVSASTVFTPLVNFEQYQTAAGTNNTSTLNGRQYAFAPNGQSIYFIDSGANNATSSGGIYKLTNLDSATGATMTKVISAPGLGGAINTEPVVVAGPGGTDRIYFSGAATGGGISYMDVNGTTPVGGLTSLVSNAVLTDFLEVTGTQTNFSMVSDGEGGIIFSNSAADGIFRIDASKRLIKVASYVDRDLGLTGSTTDSTRPATGTGRYQMRTTTGPGGSTIKELLYVEQGSLQNAIGGVKLYQPGDFNFDGSVDSSDRAAFLGALKTRGTVSGVGAGLEYDLNGTYKDVDTTSGFDHRVIVDWKDVKVLQQFLGFANGDANLDGQVNFTDLQIAAANYFDIAGQNQETWATGDFASLDPNAVTYLAAAIDANLVNLVDLKVLANNWTGGALPTLEQLQALGSAQFVQDAQLAGIPEPVSISAMFVVAFGLARRRARQ